mmetsp:Transcript_118819/g.332742  ORF Transcript_118819/g.332742 Transcript_118819/m.332742 type:complete len:125 (-) Transcript_118819:246-620(-)
MSTGMMPPIGFLHSVDGFICCLAALVDDVVFRVDFLPLIPSYQGYFPQCPSQVSRCPLLFCVVDRPEPEDKGEDWAAYQQPENGACSTRSNSSLTVSHLSRGWTIPVVAAITFAVAQMSVKTAG